MFRIFYAEQDATLFEGADINSATSLTNTGLDELLEIGKRLGTDGSSLLKSRSVIKFNTNDIVTVAEKYNIELSSCKFMLQLYTTHAKNLPTEYSIDAKIIAQPWINGTGFASSNPIISNGVQWAKPMSSWALDSQSGSLWISSSQQIQVNNTSLYVSGSGAGGSWLYQSGSGVFNISNFNQSFFTQPGLGEQESFSYRPTDINMDVTDAILLWISGSAGQTIQNNGFLLKFSDADESNPSVTGYINFFSRETHTIYVPRLTMYWDQSEYSSSLSDVDLDSYTIYTKMKPEYKDTEIARIRIYSRNKYPQKSPTNLFPTQTVNRLPETTYYSVTDAATDEVIIPYDDIYNKVSCDNVSNFIYIDMNGFMPERYYRLQFKIVDGFTEQYIDDDIYFKVVR
jgi:hypothetical protein